MLYFTHFNHVKTYEIACAECHRKAPDGRFATLSHAMCNDCHKEWMDRKTVSEKTCGQCHKKRDLTELARKITPESVNPPAASFVHTPALSNRCVQCHGVVMGPKLTQAPEMRRSDVVRMRAESRTAGARTATPATRT